MVRSVLYEYLQTVDDPDGVVFPQGRQWVNGITPMIAAMEALYEEVYQLGVEDGRREMQPRIDHLFDELLSKKT